MMSWNKITEVSRPVPGFLFSCENHHEWFISLANYNLVRYDEKGNYLPNPCKECDDARAAEANREAGNAESEG